MSAPRLNARQLSDIDSEVDEIFDLLLTRLLGGAFTGKRLFVSYLHGFSLPGLFQAGVNEEGGRVDIDLVSSIASVAQNYLNKYREEAKAATKRKIQGLLTDIDSGRLKADNWHTAVEGELAELFGKVKNGVKTVVSAETMHSYTMGAREGIIQINDNLGIDDPVLCWIHPLDKYTCEECYKLYYLPDRKTPRVWKESEVVSEYHKRGDPNPSWFLSHPNCRGALSTVLEGFGFDAQGRVTYIASDHREWDYQRGFKERPTPGVEARRKKLGKSELDVGEPLQKAVRWPGLEDELKRNGWRFEREGNKHEIWANPGVPGTNLAIKREHKSGEIPNFWLGKYARDAGLRVDRSGKGLSPDPQHALAPHYAKMGLLPHEEPKVKTWTPAGYEGLQHVPIENVHPTSNHELWEVEKHKSSFSRGEGRKVPPIVAVKEGDKYMVDQGHEQLEAAKQAGFTHVPMKLI